MCANVCSPFIMPCLGSIGMDHVISVSFNKGTIFIKELHVQENDHYTKTYVVGTQKNHLDETVLL